MLWVYLFLSYLSVALAFGLTTKLKKKSKKELANAKKRKTIDYMKFDDIPSKLVLTCTVTGKQVVWTNKQIIQKKINQFGSLDAFVKQFKCREAGSTTPREKKTREVVANPANEVSMHEVTKQEHDEQYNTRTYTYKDGINCTVVSPKPVKPVFVPATHTAGTVEEVEKTKTEEPTSTGK